MNPKQFNSLIGEFKDKEQQILDWKAGEYSDDTDRLQNFREIAEFMGDKPVKITPEMLAFLYAMKHIQSIKNALVEGKVNWCWEDENGEGTKQRLADIRNYMLLLAACLEEETRRQPTAGEVKKILGTKRSEDYI